MKLKTIHKKMPNGRKGFAVIAVADNRMEFEEMCRRASTGTTFSPHEMKAAVEILAEEVNHYLQRGLIVDLGPLGIYQPTAKSGMKPTADDFTWHDVKANVSIRPTKEMVRAADSGKKHWINGRKLQDENDDE